MYPHDLMKTKVPAPPHPPLPKSKITRKTILSSAEKCVCGERQEDYGSPEDNFNCIAKLWKRYIKEKCVGPGADVEINAEDVAAMMCLLKIGRIAGGSNSIDNWIDIAGYAACGGELQKK